GAKKKGSGPVDFRDPMGGQVAMVAETDMQAAHVHLDPTPLPEALPGCPEAAWRAAATCLAQRPEDRFARAEDLAEALRAAAQEAIGPGHPMAREVLREAEDAARARAVLGGEGQGGAAARPLESTEPLPAGFVPVGPLPARAAPS